MENDFNLKAVELDNFFEGSSPVFKLRVCPFPEMSLWILSASAWLKT